MKKQELYKVTIDGKEVFSGLTHMEYFNIMDNLSIEYYQTGSPHPDTIKTEIYLEEND
tara:strand:- start:37164 stop:37337 length:174 start_codon:yes stop_codon:yes gene_type:complete